LFSFGILIEIAQRAVGYRSADLLDLAADLAGIAAGMSIALIGAGGWTPKLEDWLLNQFG
jgi:VanZ family protein